MADLISTLRDTLSLPRRRRTDLVVSAYCEVHGVDLRADGAGAEESDVAGRND